MLILGLVLGALLSALGNRMVTAFAVACVSGILVTGFLFVGSVRAHHNSTTAQFIDDLTFVNAAQSFTCPLPGGCGGNSVWYPNGSSVSSTLYHPGQAFAVGVTLVNFCVVDARDATTPDNPLHCRHFYSTDLVGGPGSVIKDSAPVRSGVVCSDTTDAVSSINCPVHFTMLSSQYVSGFQTACRNYMNLLTDNNGAPFLDIKGICPVRALPFSFPNSTTPGGPESPVSRFLTGFRHSWAFLPVIMVLFVIVAIKRAIGW